jgi:hypothetical protein
LTVIISVFTRTHMPIAMDSDVRGVSRSSTTASLRDHFIFLRVVERVFGVGRGAGGSEGQ